MNILLLIAVLVMASASPHQYHYGHGNDNGNYPWWHPNTGGGMSPGDMSHYQPGGGGFGNDNTWGGSGRGQPDYFNGNSWNGPGGPVGPGGPGGPWNVWRRRTTEKPEITNPTYPTYHVTEPTDSGSSSMRPDVNNIEACKNSCSVTMEQNPVCGTDNITYGNIELLECAHFCGVDVQLQREGLCQSPISPSPTPLTPPIPTPTPNARNIDSVIQACIRNCPVTSEYNPVCGSNNLTYANPGQLQCVQNCGLNVQLQREGLCQSPISPSPIPLIPPTPTPTPDARNIDSVIQACIRNCPVTPEYNPVCGSNNLTYVNPGQLQCAQNCGLNVQLQREGLCQSPISPSPIPLTPPTPTPTPDARNIDSVIQACIRNCPVMPEYNPVCGSNNLTYVNPGQLQCAQNCGLNVQLQREGLCQSPISPSPIPLTPPTPTPTPDARNIDSVIQACIRNCPVTPEYNPVCGSNNLTYVNPGQLQCAQNCGLNVQLQRGGLCQSPISPSPIPLTPPTPTPTPDARNIDSVIQACIRNCPVTPEYNPVCGSNNLTYVNPGQLQCAQNCGLNVQLQREGLCQSPISPSPTPLTPPTPTPTPDARNIDSVIQACIRNCPVTSEYNPVCGSNHLTYANPGQLQCVQNCGLNVQLQREGLCQSPISPSPIPLTPPTPTPTPDDRNIDSVIQACIRNCPVTSEYNPVCGSNNLTYANPGQLQCAQNCGLNVQLQREGLCQSPISPSPTPLTPPTPTPTPDARNIDSVIQACIRNCPVTSEYNPVCGSNNLTYANPGRLQCAQNCGLNVNLRRPSACNAPVGPTDATAACISTCSVTSEYNPVCGSDNKTYANPGRLECVQNCGLNVQLVRKSACSVPPGPNNPDLRGSTESPNGNGNGNCGGNSNGKCVQSCRITPELNAVCGTDGVTYKNPGHLLCAQFCGADVNLRRPSACNAPVDPTGATAACISTCSVTSEYNPVCGSDNKTYPNPGRLECVQNCGLDVQLVRKSACSVPPGPNNPDLRGSTESPIGNGNGNGGGNSNVKCVQSCRITPEVNAVCGTDGVTYKNPGHLLCAQFCGADVRLQKFASCSGKIITTSTFVCPTIPTPTEVFTNPPTTQDCINKCAVSQEVRPVCGTDNVTYVNIESLQCKIQCGVAVSVLKLSPCGTGASTGTPPVWENTDRPTQSTQPTVVPITTSSNVIQACINKCTVSQDYKPVCGTDGVTYANLQRLQCAKRCGINVDVKSLTTCYPETDGSKDENTTDKNNFTIPAHILASVFPDYTTPLTTESDESYELDERYGTPTGQVSGAF